MPCPLRYLCRTRGADVAIFNSLQILGFFPAKRAADYNIADNNRFCGDVTQHNLQLSAGLPPQRLANVRRDYNSPKVVYATSDSFSSFHDTTQPFAFDLAWRSRRKAARQAIQKPRKQKTRAEVEYPYTRQNMASNFRRLVNIILLVYNVGVAWKCRGVGV